MLYEYGKCMISGLEECGKVLVSMRKVCGKCAAIGRKYMLTILKEYGRDVETKWRVWCECMGRLS